MSILGFGAKHGLAAGFGGMAGYEHAGGTDASMADRAMGSIAGAAIGMGFSAGAHKLAKVHSQFGLNKANKAAQLNGNPIKTEFSQPWATTKGMVAGTGGMAYAANHQTQKNINNRNNFNPMTKMGGLQMKAYFTKQAANKAEKDGYEFNLDNLLYNNPIVKPARTLLRVPGHYNKARELDYNPLSSAAIALMAGDANPIPNGLVIRKSDRKKVKWASLMTVGGAKMLGAGAGAVGGYAAADSDGQASVGKRLAGAAIGAGLGYGGAHVGTAFQHKDVLKAGFNKSIKAGENWAGSSNSTKFIDGINRRGLAGASADKPFTALTGDAAKNAVTKQSLKISAGEIDKVGKRVNRMGANNYTVGAAGSVGAAGLGIGLMGNRRQKQAGILPALLAGPAGAGAGLYRAYQDPNSSAFDKTLGFVGGGAIGTVVGGGAAGAGRIAKVMLKVRKTNKLARAGKLDEAAVKAIEAKLVRKSIYGSPLDHATAYAPAGLIAYSGYKKGQEHKKGRKN